MSCLQVVIILLQLDFLTWKYFFNAYFLKKVSAYLFSTVEDFPQYGYVRAWLSICWMMYLYLYE